MKKEIKKHVNIFGKTINKDLLWTVQDSNYKALNPILVVNNSIKR